MKMEILDKLLPLVEQTGEGAFVLAVLYLLAPYFKGCVVAGVVCYMVHNARAYLTYCVDRDYNV